MIFCRIQPIRALLASAVLLPIVCLPASSSEPSATEPTASSEAAAPTDPRCPSFAPSSEGLPTRTEWRTHPSFGDVNGDGHVDLSAIPRKGKAPAVWLGDGKGHWKEASVGLLIPGFTCGVGTDMADVNGDGHLDLGFADHCSGIHVFLGDGKGLWSMVPGTVDLSGQLGVDDLRFGDLDLDGAIDVVAVGGMRGGFRILRGDGKGGFRRGSMGLPDAGFGPDLKLSDMNGDGRLDVVAAFTHLDRSAVRQGRRLPTVWLNEPSGFRDSSAGLPDDGNFRGVAVGDVNADGYMDLAISGDSRPGRAPLLVYLGDGAKTWSPPAAGHPTTPSDLPLEGIDFADLNGDGDLDLVGVSHRDAGLRVWMGDGEGAFAECKDAGLPGGETELRGWGLAIADVNSDGRPDIAFGTGRQQAGSVQVWVQR